MLFQILRLDNTDATAFRFNFTLTGSATSGVDYYAETVMMSLGEEIKKFIQSKILWSKPTKRSFALWPLVCSPIFSATDKLALLIAAVRLHCGF